MVSYENDVLTIPAKYKNMSVPELESEKKKLLQEINSVEHQKKVIKQNQNNIVFKF